MFAFTFITQVSSACGYNLGREIIRPDYMVSLSASYGNKQTDIGIDESGKPVLSFIETDNLYMVEPSGHNEQIAYDIDGAGFNFALSSWGDYLAVFNKNDYYYKQSWQSDGDIYFIDEAKGHKFVGADFSNRDIPHLLSEYNNAAYHLWYDIKTAAWQKEYISDQVIPIAIKVSSCESLVVLGFDHSYPGQRLFVKNSGGWNVIELPGKMQTLRLVDFEIHDQTVAIACLGDNGEILIFSYYIAYGIWHEELAANPGSPQSWMRIDLSFKSDGFPSLLYPRETLAGYELILAEEQSDESWCKTVIESVGHDQKIYSPSLEYDNSDNPFMLYIVGDVLTGDLILQKVKSNYLETADYDNSGTIDLLDFSILAEYWLEHNYYLIEYDLTGDHEVTIDDLVVFVECWLASK